MTQRRLSGVSTSILLLSLIVSYVIGALPIFAGDETYTVYLPSIDNQPPPDFAEKVLIPAGSFQMGCDPNRENEFECDLETNYDLLHTVALSAYRIDKYEVTNSRYWACADAGTCTPPVRSGSFTRDSYYANPTYANFPVVNVTWAQADSFCRWSGGMLPTEAQWEKAARGSTDTRMFPWGDAPINCTLANGRTAPGVDGQCQSDTTEVGRYPDGASPYGVLDMSGNVYEWVNDWLSGLYYEDSPAVDPTGPASGEYKVLRGGSFLSFAEGLHVAFRLGNVPDDDDVAVGFRCAYAP